MMRLTTSFLAATLCFSLMACGSDPDPSTEENLEQQAEQLDAAAANATDDTQEDVLEDQAETLRDAAEGDATAVNDEGSVTVVKE